MVCYISNVYIRKAMSPKLEEKKNSKTLDIIVEHMQHKWWTLRDSIRGLLRLSTYQIYDLVV